MIKLNLLFKNRKIKTVVIVLFVLILLALGKSLFVAAVVNGIPISRLSVVKELEKQGGSEVLQTLIEKTLISQEAKKQGVKITDEVVASQITSIEEVLKEQGLTLEEALKARNQTRKDLEEQIRLQKTVEAILSQKINISEEEISQYFEENKDAYEEGTSLETVKDDIRGLLIQQKLNAEYSVWIEELRGKAKIYFLVNYN